MHAHTHTQGSPLNCMYACTQHCDLCSNYRINNKPAALIWNTCQILSILAATKIYLAYFRCLTFYFFSNTTSGRGKCFMDNLFSINTLSAIVCINCLCKLMNKLSQLHHLGSVGEVPSYLISQMNTSMDQPCRDSRCGGLL